MSGEPDPRLGADALVPLVYAELRRMAAAEMARGAPRGTWSPTVLVHEAYLRLAAKEGGGWENRRHFFFAAARAMRDLLVEEARRKAAVKRGGRARRVDFESLTLAHEAPPDDLLALDEAIERLEREDPRKARIVHLRFYAELSAEETAAILGTPLRTLEREWRHVRARLHRDLA